MGFFIGFMIGVITYLIIKYMTFSKHLKKHIRQQNKNHKIAKVYSDIEKEFNENVCKLCGREYNYHLINGYCSNCQIYLRS